MIWRYLIAFFIILGQRFEPMLSAYQSQPVNTINSGTSSHMVKNEMLYDHQLFHPQQHPKSQGRGLDTPIATNIGFFPDTVGRTHKDYCPRDKVKMQDGSCQNIMATGNCKQNEEVILDYETGKGMCVQRLCPPDRIFVHSTQLCHDPLDPDVCPAGRELFYSAYGTSACACPDGTIETGPSKYHDVCEEILRPSQTCNSHYGQSNLVRWFSDYNSQSQCLQDPCWGANLANTTALPLIPSSSGKCFPWGQSQGVCGYGSYFALSLSTLKGQCTTLDKAGYERFNHYSVQHAINEYGPLINRNQQAPHHQQATPQYGNYRNGGYQSNQVGSAVMHDRGYPKTRQRNSYKPGSESFGTKLGKKLTPKSDAREGILSYHATIYPSGEGIVHPITRIYKRRARREVDFERLCEADEAKIRSKRQTRRPFASPSNVFQTRLLGCRPGRQRGFNAKCKDTILPARVPKRRGIRAAPPIPPRPSCPGGWDVRRQCVSRESARQSVLVNNLG